MNIHQKIAGNLLRLRKEKALTQEDLANLVGKSQIWVHKIESGDEKINLDYLVLCSEALGCDLYDLIPNIHKNKEN